MAVQLDERLMEILACPADHAPLRVGTVADPDADVLTCTSCGRRYPVTDGIPVLLIDESLPPISTHPADSAGSVGFQPPSPAGS